MKTLLICPVDRPEVAFLSAALPLVANPIMGQSLVEHWLDHLGRQKEKEVLILAVDRPEQVRALVGRGERWGLKVEVIPERRELSVQEAAAKYGERGETAQAEQVNVIVLESLPGQPELPLFTSYQDWHLALQSWMKLASAPERIGVREIQPGIWAGLRARIAPDAHLEAPCWLGENVIIGSKAVVGPHVILENQVVVQPMARITQSIIGPETMVGECVELQNSLAWGSQLLNWKTNSRLHVPDAFLLCGLREHLPGVRATSWLARFTALMLWTCLFPLGLLWLLKARMFGHEAFVAARAVRPSRWALRGESFIYYELAGATGWMSRWPQLWNIVRGEMAWVGNRPLSPAQAEFLSNDFERLWLEAPVGLISLADAEGCEEPFSDEARAHASFYAVHTKWALDLSILRRSLVPRLLQESRPARKAAVPILISSSLTESSRLTPTQN